MKEECFRNPRLFGKNLHYKPGLCNSDHLGWYTEGIQFKLRWNISYPDGCVMGFLSGKRRIYGDFLERVELLSKALQQTIHDHLLISFDATKHA